MKNLIRKELALAVPAITWWFLAFGLMTLIPGYPILMSAFFICFGIFQSFQYTREANDILYSALLPIPKRDVVKSKYLMVILFEILGLVIIVAATIFRMSVMSNVLAYKANVLMAANFTFLAFVLLIYAAFNWFFVRGFFKTAYYYGKPFILFIIAATIIIATAEILHHLPGLAFLNDIAGNGITIQLLLLLASAIIYVVTTILALRQSQQKFVKIDL